ncbi:MAG TPA: AAA family ATPase, partial [Chloroflexota bacterium]|nr:AAA family ATPase [Chloroflexota bacterium]
MADETIHLRLLGGFALSSGNESQIKVGLGRQQELVAWLGLHPGVSQSRLIVAGLLWPDSGEAEARRNLRKLIHDLRTSWPQVDQWIHIDQTSLTWAAPESRARIDVSEFGEQSERPTDMAAATAAVAIYIGDLLPDWYQDWVLAERDLLRRRLIGLLDWIISRAEYTADLETAAAYANRLIREEPLREDAYLTLMKLRVASGDRAGALRAYHECASVLEQELGVEPEPAVREFYQTLLELREPAVRSLEPSRAVAIGREREWDKLQSVWAEAMRGQAGVVILSGDPGIGKTHLAHQMADRIERQGILVCRISCTHGDESAPYSAIIGILRALADSGQLNALDPFSRRELARLLPRLDPAGVMPEPLEEAIRLAGFDQGGDGEWRRRRLRDAVGDALLLRQPVLVVLDDAHWCDVESLASIEAAIQFHPEDRILVVATSRPRRGQYPHRFLDGPDPASLTELELGPLDISAVRRLAESLVGTELPADWDVGELLELTEGNPLFVVELIRSGWASRENVAGDSSRKPPG